MHFFMHLSRAPRSVSHLLVVGAVATAGRLARRGEDHRGDHQTHCADDHEDDPYGGEPEAVTLAGHSSRPGTFRHFRLIWT
jgi:hypothetical protein